MRSLLTYMQIVPPSTTMMPPISYPHSWQIMLLVNDQSKTNEFYSNFSYSAPYISGELFDFVYEMYQGSLTRVLFFPNPNFTREYNVGFGTLLINPQYLNSTILPVAGMDNYNTRMQNFEAALTIAQKHFPTLLSVMMQPTAMPVATIPTPVQDPIQVVTPVSTPEVKTKTSLESLNLERYYPYTIKATTRTQRSTSLPSWMTVPEYEEVHEEEEDVVAEACLTPVPADPKSDVADEVQLREAEMFSVDTDTASPIETTPITSDDEYSKADSSDESLAAAPTPIVQPTQKLNPKPAPSKSAKKRARAKHRKAKANDTKSQTVKAEAATNALASQADRIPELANFQVIPEPVRNETRPMTTAYSMFSAAYSGAKQVTTTLYNRVEPRTRRQLLDSAAFTGVCWLTFQARTAYYCKDESCYETEKNLAQGIMRTGIAIAGLRAFLT